MAGYLGSVPVPQATQHRESFTCTEGQTSFATAGYTAQFVDVYLNGSHLSPADFTATNGSDVVLAVAASADDVCDIISYTPFEVADQTFTGTTTMDVAAITGVLTTTAATVFNGGFAANDSCTITKAGDPNVVIRNTAGGSGDPVSLTLRRRAEDDAYTDWTFTNSSGKLSIIGDDTTNANNPAMTINYDGFVTFNEGGLDADFRVESSGNENMFFVDGGNNVVCVGGTTVEADDHFEVISSDASTNLRIKNTNAGTTGGSIIFDKTSATPADNDRLGLINFIGSDSADAATVYAQIAVTSLDVTNGSEDGRLLIGTTHAGTFKQNIDIQNGVVQIVANNDAYNFQVFATSPSSFFGIRDDGNDSVILEVDRSDGETGFLYNGHTLALTIGGALSKGSGSFKIDHPLEAKKDTHHLVHSFIEGPQADLIYRGKVALSSGSATVNIDTVAGMTEGTFVALNTDVQCFTSNETGWTATKGSVSGNILTITAQDNSCTETISWLVIGERHDPHMKDELTEWTDSDGKVILEPAKP